MPPIFGLVRQSEPSSVVLPAPRGPAMPMLAQGRLSRVCISRVRAPVLIS